MRTLMKTKAYMTNSILMRKKRSSDWLGTTMTVNLILTMKAKVWVLAALFCSIVLNSMKIFLLEHLQRSRKMMDIHHTSERNTALS